MKIELEKKRTNEELFIYNKPKKVYIPLISGGDTDITPLVKKGEYVYKGTIIAKRKGDFRIPIHSSVSGTVIDFVEKKLFDDKIVKCVVIENDFNEKAEKETHKKSINKFTKDEFLKNIKDNGIVGLSGNGFPTYVKYENKNLKKLIVNAIEAEPYVSCDYYIIKNKVEELLETIDAIIEINKLDEAIIAVKKEDTELIDILDSYIGTYLKIKIKPVNNYYMMGWEKNLVTEITKKQYNKYPSEIGVVVNNVSTIYAIYESLKYNKPLIERVVTFSGEKINKKCNVLVKIGTPIKEVLDKLGYKDGEFVSGGPMMGKKTNIDSVIYNSQTALLILNKEKCSPSECSRCGKCVSVCPKKLSPVLIMNSKNPKKLRPNSCIECGLCTYICPSKIDVRTCVINKKGVK